jgi:phage-related protein
MPEASIIAQFKALGLDTYKTYMKEASKATKGVSDSAKDAAKDTEAAGGKAAGGLGKAAKGMAVAAGAGVVAKKGFDFMKDAAGDAAGLAKQTAGLQRVTGMDAKAASAWVSTAKDRGVESTALTKTFVALSKNMQTAGKASDTNAAKTAGLAQKQQQLNAQLAAARAAGPKGAKQVASLTKQQQDLNAKMGAASTQSKGAADAFKQLGIDASQLSGMKTEDVLARMADGFQKMPDGAQKTAIAQQLLGKQAQTLMPILNQGSGALEEQMKTMDKYGLTMDAKGVKKGLELAKAQREQKAAFEGVKMSIGSALMPVMADLAKAITPVVQGFTKLVDKCPALVPIILGVAGAFAAMLIITSIVEAIQGFIAIAPALGAAFDVMLGPVGLVILAVAAVAVGLVLLYKKCTWFRDAVNAVWKAIKDGAVAAWDWLKQAAVDALNWIEQNWRTIVPILVGILTGPFGFAVAFILTHFQQVKDFVGGVFTWIGNTATGVVNWIVGAWNGVVGFFAGLPGRIVGALGGLAGRIAGVFTGALNAAIGAVSGMVGAVAAAFNSIANAAWNKLNWLVGQAAQIGKNIVNAVVHAIEGAGSAIGDAVVSLVPGPAKGAVRGALGLAKKAGAQTGVTMGAGGVRLVGEAGPEFATLPSGSRITPMPPPMLLPSQLAGGGGGRVVVPVYLDRRQIALAMGSFTADQQAAR